MANFKTHLVVGAVASSLLSTAALAGGIIPANKVLLLATAGTIGSILPDIDLQNSSPSKLLFTLLALAIAFSVLLNNAGHYSLVEMWILWAVCFMGIRYAAWKVFHEYTTHRGVFHSLIAGLFFWFLATSYYYHLPSHNVVLAWLVGMFIFFGYIIHLFLDEIYAVDFEGAHLKRSFGTALKLYDYRHPRSTFLMLVAMMVAWFVTPSPKKFQQLLMDASTWERIWQKFWPSGAWFS